MSDSSNQFAHGDANLRDRRVALGLTRAELAVKALCSVTTIYYVEQGATRKGDAREKIDRVLSELEQAA